MYVLEGYFWHKAWCATGDSVISWMYVRDVGCGVFAAQTPARRALEEPANIPRVPLSVDDGAVYLLCEYSLPK